MATTPAISLQRAGSIRTVGVCFEPGVAGCWGVDIGSSPVGSGWVPEWRPSLGSGACLWCERGDEDWVGGGTGAANGGRFHGDGEGLVAVAVGHDGEAR